MLADRSGHTVLIVIIIIHIIILNLTSARTKCQTRCHPDITDTANVRLGLTKQAQRVAMK